MPKVSVLMTVYNGQEFLVDAMKSIIGQSFSDFEFIIVNDGSTDKTSEIVNTCPDKRIKFIDNKENHGLIAALNQGLDVATGEYIARMDADDISHKDRLKIQVEYMDAHPDVGILGSSFYIFGPQCPNMYIGKKPEITYSDTAFDCPMAHPTVMMRRAVLERHKLRYRPDYKHAEDYDLWTRTIKVTKMANVPEALLLYRRHNNTICNQFKNPQTIIAAKIRQNALDFLTDIPELQKKCQKLLKQIPCFFPMFLNKKNKRKHPIKCMRTIRHLKGQEPDII